MISTIVTRAYVLVTVMPRYSRSMVASYYARRPLLVYSKFNTLLNRMRKRKFCFDFVPDIKIGHFPSQLRPLRVETGQYQADEAEANG
jgi:hypothetical protein